MNTTTTRRRRRDPSSTGTGQGAGGNLLASRFEAWARVANYNGSGPLIDQSGKGHDAKFGSIEGAYLSNSGLVLPGLLGNDASVPSSAALNITTGDIDIRVKATPTSYTTAIQYLISKIDSTGAQRSYGLRIETTGRLSFFYWIATVVKVDTSTVATPTTTEQYFRSVHNTVSGITKFYTSIDYNPVTFTGIWTQVGTDVAGTAGNIDSSTEPVRIGGVALTSQNFLGIIYRAQIFASINDTDKRLDIDFSGKPGQSSFTASTGQVVTVNQSADAGDPIFLKPDGYVYGANPGTCYMYLPGVIGNYASIADAAENSITGDQEILIRLNLATWTPGVLWVLASKWGGGAGLNTWVFSLSAVGALNWTDSVDGLNTSYDQTLWVNASATFVANTTYWLRVTIDVDNGAGKREIKLYWAADSSTIPTSWTLAATINSLAAASYIDVTSTVSIGARNITNDVPIGKFYGFALKNGINGTTIINADFTRRDLYNSARTNLTAITGQTVTINRSASPSRFTVIVEKPCLLGAVDDYLTIPHTASLDFGATDSFTIIVIYRKYGNTATAQTFLSKTNQFSNAGVGYALFHGNTTLAQFMINDGTIFAQAVNTLPLGAITHVVGRRNVGLDVVRIKNTNGEGSAADVTTGTLAGAQPISIFRRASTGVGFEYADTEFYAYGISRYLLTDAELDLAIAELMET